MRPLLLLVTAAAVTACYDDSSLRRINESEEAVKEKAIADARLKKGQLPIGVIKEWDDAGVVDAGPAPMPTSIADDEVARPLPAIDQKLLADAWRTAKTGDYIAVQCSSLVNKFGNQVLRRISARLEVVAHDDATVVLRARGRGVEEHNSTNPATRRKQWSAQHEGGGELVLAREVDPALGAPVPAAHLGVPRKKAHEHSRGTIDALCSTFGAGSEVDQRDRCVAEDTSRLFLSAGLLAQTGHGTTCQITDVGNTPPGKKLPTDLPATEYFHLMRGSAKFRERAIAAAAGMVKIEEQRLASSKTGSVTFGGKKYEPGLVDVRKVHALDWALHRVMPQFPQVLGTE